MTGTLASEDDARAWLHASFNPDAPTWDRLERYAALLIAENARQNLIAASTVPQLWVRHIVDSAQLVPLAGDGLGGGDDAGPWLDLGSGAGLPGVVAAILTGRSVMLVESRKLRCAFLRDVAAHLGLDSRLTVHESRVEALPAVRCGVISARAFAPLGKLVDMAARFAGPDTRWVLPKGRNAVNELAMLPQAWQSVFHVEHSLTDADSHILVGRGAAAYQGRNRR